MLRIIRRKYFSSGCGAGMRIVRKMWQTSYKNQAVRSWYGGLFAATSGRNPRPSLWKIIPCPACSLIRIKVEAVAGLDGVVFLSGFEHQLVITGGVAFGRGEAQVVLIAQLFLNAPIDLVDGVFL